MTLHVLPEERALVIETTDPSVLVRLPSGFELAPGVLGMPHDLDTVIRLNAMGIEAPSPMRYYYRFPRDRSIVPQPFEHQYATSGFFTANPRDYCLNGIGTGKTLSAAWAADYLMEIGAARRCLIASPLSTLERVWGDTFFIHMPHRKFVVVYGSAEKRRKLLAQPADFYIINHDGVEVIQQELAARDDIDIVILDEVGEYANQRTDRWKAMDAVIYPDKRPAKPWVWGLTATPRPHAASDVYGQCKLVTPSTVPKFFTMFRNMVMDHQSTYVWTDRLEANKVVASVMRPSIRFKRDDCLDLPPTIYSTRDVEMSPEQNKAYKEVMKDLRTEVAGGRITALNEGIKLSKLLQIACGCVYDVNGEPREMMGAGNRVQTLIELIEQVGEKVIVFVPFTAVTGMLARALNKYWNFAVVTGDTAIGERNRIFSDFQSPKDIDIIAHPGCMSHGLTLTEASTIIWYAPIDSAKTYEQACGRITRAGQKYTANIIHLAGSAVERRMYKRLETRQASQGLLLEMVERGEAQ